MRPLLIILLLSSPCIAQKDSINTVWNQCSIDTAFYSPGTIRAIVITQNEWSERRKAMVTKSWDRKFAEEGYLEEDYLEERYYEGNGFYRITGIRKFFNPKGRRTNTKRYDHLIPGII